ncbi:MAG: hypothetical protein JW722_04035 [Demequinaceae bacterium]|nr:hypothetical protein [Demequinaceae bacterium]
MPSRPSGQERIQQDLDELLGQLATLAKALLIRNGEFFPFGASIGKRGKFTLVTPVPEGDRPTAHDVVDAILADVRSSRDSLRAYGVAAMALTSSEDDAVRIELEHAEGSSLMIALPYTRGDFGTFAYGDMEARRTDRRVWPTRTHPRSPKRTTAAKAKPKAAPKATPKARAQAKATPKSDSTAKETPDSRGTSKAKPPREARPSAVGTGHRVVHTGRKTLQKQTA